MVENKINRVPALVELHSSGKSVRSFRRQSVGTISWPLHELELPGVPGERALCIGVGLLFTR